MSFPCDACGTDIDVPMFSERVDREDLALPDVAKANAISGGASITISCFSCLEEYNLHAEDGLAGMDFPCEVCGGKILLFPTIHGPKLKKRSSTKIFLKSERPSTQRKKTAEAQDGEGGCHRAAGFEEEQEDFVESKAGDTQANDLAAEIAEIPPEVEAPDIEGGTKITISCFACLEEYNLSADDGLAGLVLSL